MSDKVKCEGCGLMLDEDRVCAAMEPDQCDILEDNEPQELNFSPRERSKAFDDTDMSAIVEIPDDDEEQYD